MNRSDCWRGVVLLGLLGSPFAARALEGPPNRTRRVVDTAIDYPPAYQPIPNGGGLGGGGLGGGGLGGSQGAGVLADEPSHIHFRSEPCSWRCRTANRIRLNGSDFLKKPDGLDGYECDLEQQVALNRTESSGIHVRDPSRRDSRGVSLPASGRIATALASVRGIPRDRLDYFSWLWTTSLVVNGWTGRIIRVDPVPGGERIQVEIRPEVTGSVILAPVDYIEEYLLRDDGRLEYLGGTGKPRYRGKCVIAAIV